MTTINITDKYYKEKLAVLDALQQVMDPELGINIVDLGLVYGLEIDDDKQINISMTLSTPSCPLGNMITAHTKVAVEQSLPGYATNVTLVWDPKWNADMVSAEGKALLGW